MGQRGPLPDPGRVRRGTGNRPVRHPAAMVPSGVVVLPVAPEALPAEVRPIWDAVVADLGGRRHLRQVDVSQVYVYCEAVWLHRLASADLRARGLFVEGAAGREVLNPAVSAQKSAAATVLRFAAELGLTPSARIRMAVEEVTGLSILAGLNASLDAAVAAG